MNWKHLLWIIPIALIAGFVGGAVISSAGIAVILEGYPVVGCIMNLEESMNIYNNNLPFTIEEQQSIIQWRCAKEYANIDAETLQEFLGVNETG